MHANQQIMYTVYLLLIVWVFFIRSANLQLFCLLGILLPEEVKSIQIANLSTRKLFCHQLFIYVLVSVHTTCIRTLYGKDLCIERTLFLYISFPYLEEDLTLRTSG